MKFVRDPFLVSNHNSPYHDVVFAVKRECETWFMCGFYDYRLIFMCCGSPPYSLVPLAAFVLIVSVHRRLHIVRLVSRLSRDSRWGVGGPRQPLFFPALFFLTVLRK